MLRQPGVTTPIPTIKSRRPDSWRGLTSVSPGVIFPLAFFPVLREDRARGSIIVQIKSEETLRVVVNPVRVRLDAFLVPKTAFERFGGSMEVLNRSYADEPAPAGMGTTPAWFVKDPNIGTKDNSGYPLFDILGIHYPADAPGSLYFNSDLVEAYNCIVNHLRRQVSEALPLRTALDGTLAAAFWDNPRFSHIKPSFDAGQMDAAVPIGLDGLIPLGGMGMKNGGVVAQSDYTGVYGQVTGKSGWTITDAGGVAGTAQLFVESNPEAGGYPRFYADMSQTSAATISLSNIEAAKKTQAFAALRDRYKTVPEEYLVDLLMRGISIPDAHLRQPIRLGGGEAVIGQTERYATDGDNLDVSVANGVAQLAMTINTPPSNSGGVIMVVGQIVPEQLFERVFDSALNFGTGKIHDARVPDYLRDYLDPQKVEVVSNQYADVFHSDGAGIFGYAPTNHRWRRDYSRVGGKFKRPKVDAFSEERQRIWSVEMTDPSLSEDWYLCPQPFPKTVFADTTADPYEVITVGRVEFVGNTVFGPGFEEDYNSYDEVLAEVDMTRLESLPPSFAAAEGGADAAADTGAPGAPADAQPVQKDA